MPLFFLICLFLGVSASADTADGIVVWRLEQKTGVSDDDIDSISGIVTSEVEKYSGRKVVSEADIKAILKGEETKQHCGIEDTSCLAEIGSALGVPEAVSGDLGKLGSVWVLNLRRLNVRNAEVIGRATRQMDGDIDDLIMVVPAVVAKLFGKAPPDLPGILIVESTPPGAIVKIGQRELGKTPLKRRIEAGEHALTISLSGHLDQTREVAIKSGQKARATVELESIPMSPHKLWGHVTFWSGLGIAALGGTFTGLAKSKMDERDSQLNKGNPGAAKGARDTSKTYSGLAIAGYAVGGALMVSGAVLWVIPPDDEEWARRHQVSAGPTADGQGMMLSLGTTW